MSGPVTIAALAAERYREIWLEWMQKRVRRVADLEKAGKLDEARKVMREVWDAARRESERAA